MAEPLLDPATLDVSALDFSTTVEAPTSSADVNALGAERSDAKPAAPEPEPAKDTTPAPEPSEVSTDAEAELFAVEKPPVLAHSQAGWDEAALADFGAHASAAQFTPQQVSGLLDWYALFADDFGERGELDGRFMAKAFATYAPSLGLSPEQITSLKDFAARRLGVREWRGWSESR